MSTGITWAMIDLGMLILKLLAIAGAATTGGLGCGLLFRSIVRLSVHRSASRNFVVPVQLLGAVASALAVWAWVFGIGGGGLGYGGFGLGAGTGQGPGTEPQRIQSTDSELQPTSLSPPATTPVPDTIPTPKGLLRIEMLGGRQVKEGRFYLLEGEEPARTLADLKEAIHQRQMKDPSAVKGIEIVIYETSVAQDHPAVKDLEKWAHQNELTVTLVFPKGNR